MIGKIQLRKGFKPDYCHKPVWSGGGWHSYQCKRKIWKDEYCKQHHPDEVEARFQKKRAERIAANKSRQENIHAKCRTEIEALTQMRDEVERIKAEAHVNADHFTYDLMRTILDAQGKKHEDL